MSDWIEKLRSRQRYVEVGETEMWVEDPLWPLLCDVVEAAETSRNGFAVAPAYAEKPMLRLSESLAALKAEVEK